LPSGFRLFAVGDSRGEALGRVLDHFSDIFFGFPQNFLLFLKTLKQEYADLCLSLLTGH
jgi:hypothetical protein